MLKNRYFISYATTSLLYIAIAWAILYISSTKFFSKKDIDSKVINLTLTSFTPEVITPIEQIEQKEEIIKEELIIEEPIVEPIIEKPIVTKPIIKKIEPTKKILKKIVKPKSQKTSKTNRVKKVASRENNRVNPAKKSAFLSKIRDSINRAKSYPTMARRRGMEGSVRVSFTILSSGRVANISLSGARVFYKSAQNALMSAFPINPKNAPISLPMSLNVTLIYSIR